MRFTVLLGLSVLLVVSLTVNGLALQDEEEDMVLEERDVSELGEAEAIFYVSEMVRELEEEDDEMMSRANKGPTPAQVQKMKQFCQKNKNTCEAGKKACQKNSKKCLAAAQKACSKANPKPPQCAQIPKS